MIGGLADESEPPATDNAALLLRFVAHSEIGLIRKNNQDSGYASPRLLVVADGMGGAAAGDLASAVAIDAVRAIDTDPNPQPGDHLAELAAAIAVANDRIAGFIAEDYALEGMGTTLTGAWFDGHSLALAHIGDSRAYLWRAGTMQRLTHDHSWVQSLVDEGKISAEEAAVHPHRSLLIRVLNGQAGAEPDLTTVDVRHADRLLICSDGLCGLVEDDQLAESLAIDDLAEGMNRMVGLALTEGGIDNITVIVAEFGDRPGLDETLILGAAEERDLAAAVGPTETARTSTEGDDGADTSEFARVEADEHDDEARYAPQPPTRSRLLRPLLGLLLLVIVIGGAVAGGYAWTRTQYFVGATDDRVAIFQGLPDPIPGVALSTLYEVQPIPLSALPAAYQDQVRSNIEVDDLTAARETVARLTEAARSGTPPATASPSPAPATCPPVNGGSLPPSGATPASPRPTC